MNNSQVSSENNETGQNIRAQLLAGAGHVVALQGVNVSEQGKKCIHDTIELPIIDETDRFPIEYLPPIMADAIHDAAQMTQTSTAMAGMVALTTAAFCVQAHANVRHYRGHKDDVTSLYSMTLGETAAGKSEVFGLFMGPIREQVKSKADELRHQRKIWKAAKELADHNEAQRRARGETVPEDEAFTDPMPWMASGEVSDATLEALIMGLHRNRPSMILANDEAGAFFSGYSMTAEQRNRTRSVYTTLWGGGSYTYSTVKGGETDLIDRRLTLMLAGQPEVIVPELRRRGDMAQGFFPRMLLAVPPSMRGKRDMSASYEMTLPITEFANRLGAIFEAPSATDSTGFQLRPCIIEWSDEAREKAKEVAQAIEDRQEEGRDLCAYGDIVSRVIQNAARIAGIVRFIQSGQYVHLNMNGQAGPIMGMKCDHPITIDDFRAGLEVAWYSFQQWRSVLVGAIDTAQHRDAMKTLKKMKDAYARERGRDRTPGASLPPEYHGRFTWGGLKRIHVLRDLKGAPAEGETEYVLETVLPYLVERGRLAVGKQPSGKQEWSLTEVD
ncbi:uncharacterized protein DUF3987 [Hoeflea halophila]|uniref:Uncharacterized protein DUF3987 n=1 Tax=Hoeflea halophila TaxID=714899 RepID=A0A286IFD4_9HYPH|nr:DUF3987 domain-containing protein [Hoeflea halophila]SOE18853.1 uncharacterized protein DUF3987 [Hoeflea halophila]